MDPRLTMTIDRKLTFEPFFPWVIGMDSGDSLYCSYISQQKPCSDLMPIEFKGFVRNSDPLPQYPIYLVSACSVDSPISVYRRSHPG